MVKLAFFGEGLLTFNGRNWVECCQIMEPSFHHEALKVPFQTINTKDDRQILLSEKNYVLKYKTFRYEDLEITNITQCVGKGFSKSLF